MVFKNCNICNILISNADILNLNALKIKRLAIHLMRYSVYYCVRIVHTFLVRNLNYHEIDKRSAGDSYQAICAFHKYENNSWLSVLTLGKLFLNQHIDLACTFGKCSCSNTGPPNKQWEGVNGFGCEKFAWIACFINGYFI